MTSFINYVSQRVGNSLAHSLSDFIHSFFFLLSNHSMELRSLCTVGKCCSPEIQPLLFTLNECGFQCLQPGWIIKRLQPFLSFQILSQKKELGGVVSQLFHLYVCSLSFAIRLFIYLFVSEWLTEEFICFVVPEGELKTAGSYDSRQTEKLKGHIFNHIQKAE